ncbi:MAG: PASTA domain-containing protein, partial [Thermoleophilia bacterium]|nr:PASTA domain-containing protein [Thermoleophilia bacterium]
SDLYSLGVVMYEMGTGRVPFDGDSPVNVALKHVKDAVTRPSQFNPALSVGLESIILKAMEKDPARRYGSADEMLADLDRARDGTQTSAMTQVTPAIGATQVTPITPTPIVKPAPRAVGSRYDQQAAVPEAAFGDRGGWDDDDDARAEKRSPWRWILPAFVLVALLIAAGVMLLGGGNKTQGGAGDTTTAPQVKVPVLTGGTQPAATQKLATAGLMLGTVTPEFDENAPKGQVTRQDPGAGERVDDGSNVDLVISKGPTPIPVPDATGMTLDEASAAFSEAKFTATPTTTETSSDTVEKGRVISQSPKPNTDMVPNIPIRFVISSGSGDIQMPNVIGMSSDAAKQKLRGAGFSNISTDQMNAAEPRDQVVQQSPLQDTKVPKDQAITLTIATGSNNVPDTIGKSQDEAQGRIEDSGFVASFVTSETADPAQPLVVISSEPSQSAAVGSTITLTLGQQTQQ